MKKTNQIKCQEVVTACKNSSLADQSVAYIRSWLPILNQADFTMDLMIEVHLVDPDKIQALNIASRNINKPTNILTFTHLEGDSKQAELIICIDVIAQEAKVLGILYEEQLAHIFIHGILHAYGYDHDAPQEAEIMQAKESILMQDLGFTDPWSDTAC